ncbi:MAG: PD-(D/E)XK nuclease family protein [Alphaproteobacteria bacterium]|nr:PD-(D/E)XK nuclease family protein [Alphaproteobacteria bacterium]MDX5417082.1 PD-(D/E)XK nuclease family protein [Alphaproteobacteria bacterium]MDX5494495.1 PD-(D/E)XK nuclease family protein [Alphaproteobacteria bacterium]
MTSFSNLPIERLKVLLEKAEKERVLEKYKGPAWTPETFERIRYVVFAAKAQHPPPNNPFRITGWQPPENKINDALAELLMPSPDLLGQKVISRILQFLLKSGDKRCKFILDEISGVTCRYSVRREFPHGDSRPDIAIFSDTFVIFIENKTRRGTETFYRGQHQTERQSRLLQRFGDDKNIPQSHRIGIFLTPTGASPKHLEHYHSISTKDFCSAARQAILEAHRDPEASILESPRSILSLAFLWAYEDAS